VSTGSGFLSGGVSNSMNSNYFTPVLAELVDPSEIDLPPWPDEVDSTLTVVYLLVIFGIPLLGYFFMVLDFRRYLRSLRRALVVVKDIFPSMPYWALKERPNCLKVFDLSFPCTEEEILAAYRSRAKTLHPDHGGDLQQFLRLQKNFEQALQLVRGQNQSQGSNESAD